MGDAEIPAEQTAPAVPPFTITRRRLALFIGGLVALWLVGVFARQVGEASAATTQADELRSRNVAMQNDVDSLRQELSLVRDPAFAAQMARGYTLGTPGEIPLVLDQNAPALPADAPGSAGIKPETRDRTLGPLESWLQALFGNR
jgi:hypothetical protein